MGAGVDVIPYVAITVVELSDSQFRSDATLPNGTSVTVIRESREEAIRECSNKCNELAGVPIRTSLPFCAPQWSLPHWKLPQFKQYDPDPDPPVLPAAMRETQDGAIAVPLDDMMEGSDAL